MLKARARFFADADPKTKETLSKIEDLTILSPFLIASILEECVNDLDKRLGKIESKRV